MKTFLSVLPSDRVDLSQSALSPAHIGYRISSMRLMRGRLASNTKTGIMIITDIDTLYSEGSFGELASEIYNECLRREYSGIVLDLKTKPTINTSPFAKNLCKELSSTEIPVYVPYLYSVFAPNARYLVSSAVSGGSLREHLSQLIDIHGIDKIALEAERITMDFKMPSKQVNGKTLTQNELDELMKRTLAQSFYSPELCTNYFTYTDELDGSTHFVVFDNAYSIVDKLNTASSLGVQNAFLLYPELKDISQPILDCFHK